VGAAPRSSAGASLLLAWLPGRVREESRYLGILLGVGPEERAQKFAGVVRYVVCTAFSRDAQCGKQVQLSGGVLMQLK
jgi:hypothetical protein